METSGEWFGSVPPDEQGDSHVDGHVNFFSPGEYEDLLQANGFEIVSACLVPSIVPPVMHPVLFPEWWDPSSGLRHRLALLKHPVEFCQRVLKAFPGIPWSWKRKMLGGGDHICLCKSKLVK